MNVQDSKEWEGYRLYSSPVNQLPLGDGMLVSTINQYSYCIAERDPDFKHALQHSDVLLPDGISIVIAARLLKGLRLAKIAGSDVHQHYLNKLNQTAGSCFYLGSSPETLRLIENRLRKEYPRIRVGSYSPPYKERFSDADNERMVAEVNAFRPDVLFVGMTAPKQEKWTSEHRHYLDAGVVCSVGAVFDFYAGTVRRPAKIWIGLGLEWFVRLVREPRRLAHRYIQYGMVFCGHMVRLGRHRLFGVSE